MVSFFSPPEKERKGKEGEVATYITNDRGVVNPLAVPNPLRLTLRITSALQPKLLRGSTVLRGGVKIKGRFVLTSKDQRRLDIIHNSYPYASILKFFLSTFPYNHCYFLSYKNACRMLIQIKR
jgi:hypothetical protein